MLTGTSSEFLGRRALPRILRRRNIVIVLGPPGAGKTSVAVRMATLAHPDCEPLWIDTATLTTQHVHRARRGCWPREWLNVPALVLDGPTFLSHRPGVLQLLRELLYQRAMAGHRTSVVQINGDESVNHLMPLMEPGSMVIVGLRFPRGNRGRLKLARRLCRDLEIPSIAARGSEHIRDWTYANVVGFLQAWKAEWEARGRPQGPLHPAVCDTPPPALEAEWSPTSSSQRGAAPSSPT